MDEKDAKYLIQPQKRKFWKFTAALLLLLAIGDQHWWHLPRQVFFFYFHKYLVIVLGPIILFSQIVYLYYHSDKHDVLELANIAINILMNWLMIVKTSIALTKTYKKLMVSFMDDVHIFNYSPRTPYSDEVLIKVEKMSKKVSLVIMVFFFVDFTSWVMAPVIYNMQNGAFASNGTIALKSYVYMYFPFDYDYEIKWWIFMYLISSYVGLMACITVLTSNIVFMSMFLHLIGRLDIMKHNMEYLTEKYLSVSEEYILNVLGTCVREHVLILQTFQNLQSAFEISVAGNYIFNMVFGAVSLLNVLDGDKMNVITYGIMIQLYMGSFILTCLIFEGICIKSDKMAVIVYDMPWERMSTPHRRIVLVLLARIQPPLEFKIMGVRAGLGQVVSIIKTTFSYYVMLKSKK